MDFIQTILLSIFVSAFVSLGIIAYLLKNIVKTLRSLEALRDRLKEMVEFYDDSRT